MCCIKVRHQYLPRCKIRSINQQVYTLERVLKLKKDPGTGVMFLDEAMKVRPVGVLGFLKQR